MDHKAIIGLIAFAFIIFSAPIAAADSITLLNQRTIDGIIVEENDSTVRFQVDSQGFITFDRRSVIRIKRTDEADHEKMISGWRQGQEAREKRDREVAAFEIEQQAKGLIQHDGRWITPAELKTNSDFKRLEERLESRIDELQAQIRSLREENQRLRQELLAASSQITVVREPVFIQQNDIERRDRHRVPDRDKDRDKHQKDHDRKDDISTLHPSPLRPAAASL